MSEYHVYGIRHHGPGSARSLRQALEAWRPDTILVEGPPEGEAVLALAAQAQMQPPVALLIYRPDLPQTGVFAPFAVFSPEWQALQYGLQQALPVRFIDLPQAHQMALTQESNEEAAQPVHKPGAEGLAATEPNSVRSDPFAWLAE